MKKIISIVITIAIFTSCQSSLKKELMKEVFQNETRDTNWVLKSIDENPYNALRIPSVSFRDNFVTFHGGCNGGSAKLESADSQSKMKFSDIMVTSMACDKEILTKEQEFYTYMRGVFSYELKTGEGKDVLMLKSKESTKESLLKFQRMSQIPTAKLEETNWNLIAIYLPEMGMVSSLFRDTFLELTIKEGQLNGKSDCGIFTAKYNKNKEKDLFSEPKSTFTKCEKASLMQSEKFLKDLKLVKNIYVNVDRLFFVGDGKKNLYEFQVKN